MQIEVATWNNYDFRGQSLVGNNPADLESNWRTGDDWIGGWFGGLSFPRTTDPSQLVGIVISRSMVSRSSIAAYGFLSAAQKPCFLGFLIGGL